MAVRSSVTWRSIPARLRARRRLLAIAAGIAVAVWIATLDTSAGQAANTMPPRLKDPNTYARFVEQGWDSPFGLDYVFVHSPGARDQTLVDDFCKNVSVRWVNFTRLEWRIVEKAAPRNGRHSYNWSDLDKAVRTWQRNGVHIMVSLRFASPWATAPRNDKEFVYLKSFAKRIALAGADYLPKPEHMQDLRDYVRNLVERYDGDGKDDMPGLLFPVLHYQVGNEYYNEVFWTGSVDHYGQLLREFSKAARSACPDVKVILSGIGFKDIYGYYDVGMDPRTQAYVRQNLPKVSANMWKLLARADAFSRKSASFRNAYDILDARWPNYGIVVKSKELLRQAHCGDKPVWSAEIYSGFPIMEPLVLPNWTLQAWPTPSRSREYLRILKNPRHPKFAEVNAWYRGMQAAQVVKICMVALHAGSRKLMVGWAVDAQNQLAVSTFSHHGLYSITFKRLWPAAYTYDLVIEKLSGMKRIERLNRPGSANAYVYRCTLDDERPVWVAFCDDHIGQNHDQPTASVLATVPVSRQRLRVTHAITEIGQTKPKVVHKQAKRGRLQIRLTEYPVFIEAEEPSG